MNFLIMLRVGVCIAIFAQLPLLEFVREVSRRLNRFGISLHAHRLLDISMGHVEIGCAPWVSPGSGRSDAHAEKERASTRLASSKFTLANTP